MAFTDYVINSLILSAIVVIFAIYYFFKTKFKYWKDRNIPYIQPYAPLGNTLELFLGRVTFGELFSNAYLEFKKRGVKHGGIFYLWKPVYVPVDDEIIKKILIKDFENFPNHGLFISGEDPLSTHVFNMEDYRWKTIRSKLPSAFTSAKMRRMFIIMNRFSSVFIERLKKYAATGHNLNVKDEISKFTTDIISACAFGMESKTMTNENTELLKHGRLFFDYQWNLIRNTLVIMVPRNILQFFKFRIFPKKTEEYITRMFEDIKQYREHNAKQDVTDLASILVKMTQEDINQKDHTGKTVMVPLSMEEFTAQMFVFFSAGFETSSSTQTFAIYELSKNIDIQQKLREEIVSVLAKHDGQLTYDALMEMEYLDHVVDETLRLYPVFPILPRVCNKDYKIPGTDVILEQNTFVLISNMGIQRDPLYYTNPEKFDPNRFLKKNKAERPFVSHLPFGEGPRICVGKRFGLLQTKLGLINMIKNFEVTLNDRTKKDFNFVSRELILRKAGDIWVDLKVIT